MWLCSQGLMQLPFELQFKIAVSSKHLNSHFFLSAFFRLLWCYSYSDKFFYSWGFQGSSGRELVLFCFSVRGSKYTVCWTISSVYTILMTLHSCHFIYAFELFKSQAPGWKQSEVAAWVFSPIKVMCLMLQLNPHHFLPEYLAQGCSAGFGFVEHLLRKSADYRRPQEHNISFMLAFENVGLTPAQHRDPLRQSPLNANFNQCHFLINQSL